MHCPVCQGDLEYLRDVIKEVLPAGLHKVADNVLPVRVPVGEPWTLCTQLMRCMHCSTHCKHITLTNGDKTMTDIVTPVNAEEASKPTREELLEKVRRLSETIEDVTDTKKAAAKDYNDQLKSLKDEMHDTLETLKNTPKQG